MSEPRSDLDAGRPRVPSGWYDCSAALGRSITFPVDGLSSAASLVAEMDWHGIEKALVYHVLSRDLSPDAGNRRLMESIAGDPRLLPVWGVLPEHADGTAARAALRSALESQGVRAVRLFPAAHRHHLRLTDWMIRPLLECLAESGTLLLIGRDEIGWDDLDTLLSANPAVPVVLVNPGYRHDRHLFPLLDRHAHLHLEASTYVGHGGIDRLIRRVGSTRLVLGTQMPEWDPGAILAVLAYADLRDDDLANIRRENLRRLLGDARA